MAVRSIAIVSIINVFGSMMTSEVAALQADAESKACSTHLSKYLQKNLVSKMI